MHCSVPADQLITCLHTLGGPLPHGASPSQSFTRRRKIFILVAFGDYVLGTHQSADALYA